MRGSFRLSIVTGLIAALAGSAVVGTVGANRSIETGRASSNSNAAQIETAMNFDPAIECWYHDQFPQLDAGFDPAGPFAQNRLYFKCTSYQDYYFVDLAAEGAGYRAVAPMAEDNCPNVEWYVEVVRPDFSSSRSETRTAPVTSYSECRRRNPGVAFFQGDPQLVVGTTGPAAGLLGFKPAGVVSFITAAGEIIAAGGAGGGLSTAAIAGIAAGGAGAVVLGATAGGDDNESGSGGDPPGPTPSTTAPPPPTTPPPPPGPAPTPSVTACIETNPSPPMIEEGDAVAFDGRCSTGNNLQFRWDILDDGRSREGNFVNFRFGSAGVFTVRLTVTQPATVQSGRGGPGADEVVVTDTVEVTVEESLPELLACFTVSNNPLDGQCNLSFDADCSKGKIVLYRWLMDITNAMGSGSVQATGKTAGHDWTFSPNCNTSGGNPPPIGVQLTVTDELGRTATAASTVNVVYFTSPFLREQEVDAVFSSYLGVAPFDGRVAGQVRHNESQVDVVNNASPSQHNIRGRLGENVLEAYTTTPTDGPGYWRFDFSGAGSFVAGSLKATSGEVLSVTDRVIVFRLNGQPGERIRFKYQLLP